MEIGFFGACVFDIGGEEFGAAGFEIVVAFMPENLDHKQVSGEFLDGPPFFGAAFQDIVGQAAQFFLESCRGAADAFDDIGVHLRREIEFKFAVEPDHSLHGWGVLIFKVFSYRSVGFLGCSRGELTRKAGYKDSSIPHRNYFRTGCHQYVSIQLKYRGISDRI